MRAASGFDANDAFLDQDTAQGTLDMLGILGRNHVVGDDQNAETEFDQDRRDPLDNRGFSGADRAADADARNFFHNTFPAKAVPG